jgi:hypothetical protein
MNKKFAFSLAFCLLTVSFAFSQVRKIPAEVIEAFKTKFPAATAVSWTDKLTAFQASFEQEGAKWQASFNSKGEWKKTEKELPADEQPAFISSVLKEDKYNGYTLKSVTQIWENDDSQQYRLSVEKSTFKKKYIYLNKEGEVLRESIKL